MIPPYQNKIQLITQLSTIQWKKTKTIKMTSTALKTKSDLNLEITLKNWCDVIYNKTK